MDRINVSIEKFRADLENYPILHVAEQKTGVQKFNLVFGAVLGLLALLLLCCGVGVICNLVGFVYPAYASFRAIEASNKTDDQQWLTYWVVYACFNIIEVFAEFLLRWIPFYYAFKLGFLFWLFFPSTQGASFLYQQFLEPFLKANESRIDKAMKEVASGISDLAADVAKSK